jgi:hypothetical protein
VQITHKLAIWPSYGLLFKLPRVVGADAPRVAFEVAAAEVAAAVVHVSDVDDHLGSCGLCGGVDGVGVGDDEVGALSFAAADLVGLDHVFAGFAAVVDGAKHDHAAAEGELGMHDCLVVGAEVDGLFFESEGGAEPFDCGECVAVAEARDDGGVGGVDLCAHGWKCAIRMVWWSWKNRRCGRDVLPDGPPAPSHPANEDLFAGAPVRAVTS